MRGAGRKVLDIRIWTFKLEVPNHDVASRQLHIQS